MRNEMFLIQAMNAGGNLVAAVIVMFFVVLAFRKESITHPTLFKWAVGCLSAAIILPMFALLFGATTEWGVRGIGPRSDAAEIGSILIMIGTVVSPLMFFSSIVLGLFALLPSRHRSGRSVSHATEQTRTPKAHPLD